jgi:hypothetical protein
VRRAEVERDREDQRAEPGVDSIATANQIKVTR